MPSADAVEWINSSSHHTLKRHGITCSQGMVEKGMLALRTRIINEARMRGIIEKYAIKKADEIITPSLNQNGNPVWRIRASEVDTLRQWIDGEKRWINHTDSLRIRKMQVSGTTDTLDIELAKLYRQMRKPYEDKGLTSDVVSYLIEMDGLRRDVGERGQPVWRIREDFFPRLRSAMKESGSENPWINSHDNSGWKSYGFSPHAQSFDKALANYRARLLDQYFKLGFNEQQAQLEADKSIRPSQTRHGQDSWDINRAHIEKILPEILPALVNQEETWLTPSTKRWQEHGVQAHPWTIKKAIWQLRDDMIAKAVAQGVPLQTAQHDIATRVVREGVGKGGHTVVKVHTDFILDVSAILKTFSSKRIPDSHLSQSRLR